MEISEMRYRVVEYEDKYQEAVIDLILPIQQNELNVPATISDQPDLLNISSCLIKKEKVIFGSPFMKTKS